MATAVQNYMGSDEQEAPKYGLGVLAGIEYSKTPDAELSTEEINALKDLCAKAARRDYPARLIEVIQAWEPLAVETPIPTPCGWKTMGSIRAGDYVFGSNGRIASVTHAHEIQEHNSYALFFSDGTSIIAGERHSWMTTTCKERSAKKEARERTTKKLFLTQDKQHAVAMQPGLQTFDADLRIDPYLLGCWLGDGIGATGEICGNETDIKQIIAHIPGAKFRKKISRAYGTFCLATVPEFRSALYSAGLLKNKRIPGRYLRASHEQRLALLQGLMDTDGWATTNGGCGWGQFKGHKGLIDSFSELLRSLGIKHQFHAYERNREDGQPFEFWQTTFYTDLPAFRLPRKATRQRKTKGNRSKLNYLIRVEEVGRRKVRCLSVDTPDHLFLAGEGMIPTHNCALFYRGFQFLVPLRGGGWKIPGESTGYGPSMQMDLSLLPTNIYSTYGQIIISSLTRSVPNVRFEAQDPTNDAQITAAESADKFTKVITRNNDLIMVQGDASRYLWTDGRFCYYTRFVKDGQRFGWEEDDAPSNIIPENEPPEEQADAQIEGQAQSVASASMEEVPQEGGEEKSSEEEEAELEDVLANRTPRGQEVRTAHGKLEVKLVPMMANTLPECHALQFETEIDVSTAKGMFLSKAEDIKSGGNGISEGEIARLARQNVKLGMQSTYVTSDSIAEDVTIQRTWFRPSALMSITNDSVRDSLIRKFPDGPLVVYAGETFCYARNESMDECWALGQAYSGDGQNRNALGTSTMPIQKRLNNWLDLMNDFFVRAIPKKWMDSKAFNVEAIRGQTNIPGDVGAFKRQPGTPTSELVFVEPAVVPPLSLAEFVKEYSGPLAELLSGGYPALSGGQPDTDTFRGLALQRDQALGRLGPTWHSLKNAEAVAMRQAVRWAAKCRDKSINEKISGTEAIRLEINDLKANIMCYAESDENFPESYPQKQQRLMGIFQDSAKNPQLQEVLYNPANLEFLQSMVALPELYIPQVAAHKKQLGEIEILLQGEPVPNPAVVQAQEVLANMKTQGVDPAMLAQAEQQVQALPQELSSVHVDPLIDDNETEMMTCWMYLNSPEGRKSKRTNQKGFQNVRLHFIEHQQAGQQKTAANQPAQQKPPSKSMALKDMGPGERTQLLAQGGIQADPTPPPMPQGAGMLPAAPAVEAPVQ